MPVCLLEKKQTGRAVFLLGDGCRGLAAVIVMMFFEEKGFVVFI